MPGGPDGHVAGLTLSLSWAGRAEPLHAAQLALRSGVPLQATLFQLCENVARTFQRQGTVPADLRGGVTILHHPALHGTAADPDLRGVDPSRRALLMAEGSKIAWVYDPTATADGLLETVGAEVHPMSPVA